LNNKAFNPKIDLTNVEVYKKDLLEVFEPKCSLKLTNPLLHLETKQDLKRLHWRIYNVPTLTNNDFMLWLVKGYITQEKGHKVNWAKTTTSTSKKAQRRKVGRLKNGSLELSNLSAGEEGFM